MSNKAREILYLIVLLVLLAAAIGLVAHLRSECDGTLVRGAFWYECIEDQP